MGIGSNINFFLVFSEGLISFFSPCVIPLIPLYMAYLAGSAKTTDENGNISYGRKTVFTNTVFFVLGISMAFFILGIGVSSLGNAIKSNRDIIARVGGVVIILFGLVQLGVFRPKFLNREYRMGKKAGTVKMNIFTAFVMGFVFSFAWTPCVGPALASVLILASNAKSALEGNLLVLLYAAGFVIPFLFLGLFTTQTLNFIKNRQNVMKNIVKVGGVILIIMGVMLVAGTFGKFESLFNPGNETSQSTSQENDSASGNGDNAQGSSSQESDSNSSGQDKKEKVKPYPIVLNDQYGKSVSLESFKGKTVFLNFFATWCPPCRAEIPDIESLYEDNGYNKKDVIVLGVASPGQGREQDLEGVKKFIKDQGIKYPVLMDTTGRVFEEYGAYSLPTTFLINKEGYVYGYTTGGLSRQIMDQIVEDAINNKPLK